MKVEVTNPLKNNLKKAGVKVSSIGVSFFIGLRNCNFDLFNNVYIKKELINICIN